MIWLLYVNKIKSSESVSEQPTQLIVEHNTSLRQKFGAQLSLENNHVSKFILKLFVFIEVIFLTAWSF